MKIGMGTWGLDPGPRSGLVRQECGWVECRVWKWIAVRDAGGRRLVQGTWELGETVNQYGNKGD